MGSCITISTRVSGIKNLLQNWPYRSSDRKLPWAISEISRHLRFTKRERLPTRLLMKMMITSDKMYIFKKVLLMNMRHFHWKFAGLQLLALASTPLLCRSYPKTPNFHILFFTSKRVKYAIFTAISCPRASKISGFRPPASHWQVRLGVRKLNVCAVHFYT